jgi:hypothetical protein
VVRRLGYEVFRWAHWAFIPMIILAGAHMSNTFGWFQASVKLGIAVPRTCHTQGLTSN